MEIALALIVFALIVFKIITFPTIFFFWVNKGTNGEKSKKILWSVIGGTFILLAIYGLVGGATEPTHYNKYDHQDFEDTQRNHDVLEKIKSQYGN